VIVRGSNENEWSVTTSNEAAYWLNAGKAMVLTPGYPNYAGHSFPVDFGDWPPEWLAFVQEADEMGGPWSWRKVGMRPALVGLVHELSGAARPGSQRRADLSITGM
jgi:hypothetical protein